LAGQTESVMLRVAIDKKTLMIGLQGQNLNATILPQTSLFPVGEYFATNHWKIKYTHVRPST
jgi:hypothetical protein